LRDVLLGLVTAADEPISGGRHKVFGSADLAVIPQTSTIASHLPRAVGVAFAIARSRKLGVPCAWPRDALVVASLGDASMNHSTAVGALNTAAWCVYQGLPMPLLVVCEDNGLGISVPTPTGWVAAQNVGRPGFRYLAADGADPASVYDTAFEAADHVRRRRTPALLHLSTVRFGGHAGSDVETAYRTSAQIAADVERDPVLGTARLLVGCGALTVTELVERWRAVERRVRDVAAQALSSRALETRAEVVAPLAPRGLRPAAEAAASPSGTWLPLCTANGPIGVHKGNQVPSPEPVVERLTLAQSVNRALGELLEQHPELLVFGEDVARKGGVYGVTRGLQKRFGAARVFDTLLDEQAILGLALGAGVSGLLPVPEIQYLAYLHNAEDQLRGEAASLQFFSRGQFRNPMVVRIAGYAYQRGFGGHFHNDNGIAVLRDVPGLVVASPSRPDDAAAMLRTCVASASVDGSVCAFVEPIALYHERDLLAEGDDGWLAPFPRSDGDVPIGSGRTYGDGADLTVVTFGNGVRLALRVAERLRRKGIGVRVLDLRWLAPLPVDDLLREASAAGRVLVVDETRHAGGVGEGVVTALVEGGFRGGVRRVAAADSFVPLGAAANLVLVQEDEVERAAVRLVDGG
ncbi:MAG TPA: transketolase C-terminal domain-containing protein, partial [Actinomycetales bacterium]|nr:transketolase C-terminal domain-containing protein [Actinomycetales bacterium]